jgi:tetratricopeptide (TPR) repeat protein
MTSPLRRPATVPLLLAALALCLPAAPLAAQRLKVGVPLKDLQAAAQRDSNDAVAHYNVGLGYWSTRKYAEAEASLRAALDLDPRLAPAHIALAYLPYARRGKLWEEVLLGKVPGEWRQMMEESDRHYRAAFLIDPLVDTRIVAAVTPGKALAFEMLSDYAKAYDLLFRGFDDFNEGKYEMALGRFNNLMRETGWDTHQTDAPNSIFLMRGLALGQLKRWGEARQDFTILLTRAEEKEAGDSLTHIPLRTNEYRYMLAYLSHRASDLGQAMRLYREAAEADIGLYMAHVRLASIHEVQGRVADAIAERRLAINGNPDDATLVRDLGLALGKANRLEEALAPLEEAAERMPRDPLSQFYLGLVHFDLKHHAESRAALERFLALAPSRLEAQVSLAKAKLAELP